MPDDLLAVARRQAQEADRSVRAAALLRIARVECVEDVSRAARTLHEGLDQVRQLPSPDREYLLEEARLVAAAVEPKLLTEIPITRAGTFEQFIGGHIVKVMLEHGHIEAASDYLLSYNDAAVYAFPYLGSVLHRLQSDGPENVARRLSIIRWTVEMWRRIPSARHNHQRHDFIRFLGHFWKELPQDEALAVVHELVEQALQEADTGASADYMHEIHFSSSRQHLLFEMLHVVRYLDQALAQTLVDSYGQLAIAARRFPYGLETIYEEAIAEAERRKAAGATCEVGYVLWGDPDEIEKHQKLLEATGPEEFGPAIDDALEEYRQDASPSSFNYAPKEFWPSTGRFREVFYLAGKRVGSAAATLLDKIPDPGVRLFATIELAAGLTHLPEPLITRRSQPNSPQTRQMSKARVVCVATRCAFEGPPMRAHDGRLIRCPKCLFQPAADLCWSCKCNHVWNTFSTSGRCPACQFQWEVTQCPFCEEMSPHPAWYVNDSESFKQPN